MFKKVREYQFTKNDIKVFFIIFAALIIFGVFVWYYTTFIGTKANRELSAFIDECGYSKIVVKIRYESEKISKTITDKKVICSAWEIVKNARAPTRQIKRGLYDFHVWIAFYKEDRRIAVVDLERDINSKIVKITFYGESSGLSLQGLDDKNLIEDFYQLIIGGNDFP